MYLKNVCIRDITYYFLSEFYGKEGTYNVMAGKDPSHAIAKWSLEVDDIHDNIVSISLNSPLKKSTTRAHPL